MCQEQLRVQKSDQQQGGSYDASVTDLNDSTHIYLTRPNTFVLHSTVPHGKAVRGVYTKAIAKQIGNSDGKTTIEAMHTEATAEVHVDSQAREIKQQPKIESTSMKFLILPRSESAGAASVTAMSDEQTSIMAPDQSGITGAASTSSHTVQIEMNPLT